MPDIRITHGTRYRYLAPVALTPHRLMIRPQDSHDLRLHDATLTVDPPPATTRWAHDVFGNSVCYLEWAETARTDHLVVTSRLDLTHYPAGPTLPGATLDPAAEFFPFSYASDEVPDLARLTERQVPDPAGLVDSWARRFVGTRLPTLAVLEAMTQAVKNGFVYEAREAEGTQSPSETLSRGTGTCRDFALLMMEGVRALGLAARFVTGYLYDSEAQGGTIGGGATHAWCSVYLPGAGWVEYDPTNGLTAGTNLIRIASTRTPEQAVPMAGGFIGRPGDALPMEVEVTTEVRSAAIRSAENRSAENRSARSRSAPAAG
jgi:transglutaminase-like putative cysteine protease